MKKIFELYKEIKAKHPEHLLLIGDGDFYFLFEKDAVAGNKCLGTDMNSRSDIAETPVNIVEFPHIVLTPICQDWFVMVIRLLYVTPKIL